MVNRIGDVGMLVGMGLLWISLGTFQFEEINQGLHNPTGEFNESVNSSGEDVVVFHSHDQAAGPVAQIPYWMLTLAGLGVFAGCVGKSAQ